MAEALANSVFRNIEQMHIREGILVSEWTPKEGKGRQVTVRDLSMSLVALRDLAQSWDIIDRYAEIAERARAMLEQNARFLVKVQGKDGSFHVGYSVPDGSAMGPGDLGAPHWAAIRDLVQRDYMERIDGTLIPLPASRPIKIGLGTVLNLSGQQIFDANCAGCHGQHGEGIDGMSYADDVERTHEAMFKIVNTGRHEKFMPPWGEGNADGFGGTLTRAEIDKIIKYVQGDEFKKRFYRVQKGEVVAGAWPKDVWFYLSRDNARAQGKKISNADDARRYYEKHQDPAEMIAARTDNLSRVKPDADLTMADKPMLEVLYGLVEKLQDPVAQNE